MSTERTCPVCQAPVSEGAVICVQCGYDFRTGGKVQADPHAAAGGLDRGARVWLGLALAATVVIVAGLIFHFTGGGKEEAKKETSPAPPPPVHSSGGSQLDLARRAKAQREATEREAAKRKAAGRPAASPKPSAQPGPAAQPARSAERAPIPETMPVPEARLAEEEWNKRFEEARKTIDLAALKNDRRPAFALRLVNVASESQAEHHGMAVGDRIAEVNGKPTRGIDAMNEQYRDADNVVQVWSPEKGLRNVRFPKSHMGVSYMEDWLPELACAHGQEADPRWAGFLVVAARAYITDDALAETALHHAYQAGYRGWMLPALMVAMGALGGRNDAALAYGYSTYKMVPENERRPVLSLLYRAALLEARFDFARKLNDEFPGLYLQPLDWNPAEIWKREQQLTPADWALLAGDPPALRNCTEQGGTYCESLNQNAENLQGQIQMHGAATYDLKHDVSLNFAIGPVVKNPSLTVRFRLKESEHKTEPLPWTYTHNSLAISLVDTSTGVDQRFAQLRVWATGKMGIEISGYEPIHIATCGLYKTSDYNDVTLLLNGPWAEARLNGRRVFLGLLPVTGRAMNGRLRLVEVNAEIPSFSYVNLAPERARAPSAAAGAAPRPVAVPPRPDGEAGWFYDKLVQAYLDHGRRDTHWDADAADALAGAARFWSNPHRTSDVLDILRATRRAIKAGCNDPLVLFTHGEMLFCWEGGDWFERGRAYAAASENLLEYPCHPIWKFAILNQVIRYGMSSEQDTRRGDLMGLSAQVTGLLPEILNDPAAPRWFVRETLLERLERTHGYKGEREQQFNAIQIALDAADKKGDIALAYKGRRLIDLAWDARGSGWASTVSDEGWKLFHERLEAAKAALEEAVRLDHGNAQASAMLLTVALGIDDGENFMENAFADAVKADPDDPESYGNKLYYLRPRWHGSWDEMSTFARSVFDKVRDDPRRNPALAFLMLDMHKYFADDQQQGAENSLERNTFAMDYWTQPEVWADVQRVFACLLKRKPDSRFYKSQYAYWAVECRQWKLADALFRELGEDCAPSPFGGPKEAWGAKQKARLRVAGQP